MSASEKTQQKRPGSGANSQRNSGSTVPLLKNGEHCNILKFKNSLSAYLKGEFGKVARFIETGEYEEPTLDRSSFEGEQDEIIKDKLATEAVREYMLAKRKYNEAKERIYGKIWGFCSDGSRDEIELQHGFAAAEEAQDPLLLWKLITTTHSAAATTSRNADIMRANARRAYSACAQGAHQSLNDHYKEWKYLLQVRNEAGNEPLTSTDEVIDFVNSLDITRYGEFVREFFNSINNKSRKMPKTVQDAFQEAVAS